MKSFFKYLYEVVESIGRAKAATHFARMGRHDLAKEIMLKN
jgi:hypothetical protein